MTSRFHIMHDPRFRLVHQVTQRFSDGPDGGQIRLARTGFTLDPAIKKKAEVYPALPLTPIQQSAFQRIAALLKKS